MILKKYALLLFLFLIAVLPAVAQRDSISLATIVSKTDKLAAEHPFEKVYIHFDKPYYAVGDTIWLKTYLTIGPKHQLSALSSIVYVEVMNSRDSVLRTLKIYSGGGIGFGDIPLVSPAFMQGNYRVRAYTNWMKNFGPEYFFNKIIAIGDIKNNVSAPGISFTKTTKNKDQVINARLQFKTREGSALAEKKVTWTIENEGETASKGRGTTDRSGYITISFTNDKLSPTAFINSVIEITSKRSVTQTFPLKNALAAADVQFFPEGGGLTSGVRSKVAFKAIGANGLGVDVSGSVTDNTGTEVASFTSQHAGMGIFPLLPEDSKNYKATITFPGGVKADFDLPKISSGGISLSVNNSDPDNLNIKVATNDAYFKAYQNHGFYIVAQSAGTIYYAAAAPLQSLVYTASVAKSKFPTGLLQLTLFSSEGEPLSERVLFIQHNDGLNIALTTDKAEYTTRQHVGIQILAKSTTVPVEGSFSIAVVDENKVPYNEDAETTILSSMLLTSELRGYIEKPNYYFNKIDAQKLADLDVLMLTQGYRRFSYSDLIADKYPSIANLPERGMDISGTLRTTAGVPINRGNISLVLSDRNVSQNTVTDPSGQFKFTNVSIFDSTKVVLSARNNPNSNDLMIVVDPQPAMAPVKGFNDPGSITNIDSVLSAYLLNSKKQAENSHVLNEVVIKGTRPVKVEHKAYTALVGLSLDADQVLSAKTFEGCGSDFEGCVLPRVFGLWHVETKFYIKKDYDAGNKKPVMFFVNGITVDDGYLHNINPADIESMEVYFKDGIAGLFSFYQCNGIISITTKSKSFDVVTGQKADLSLLISQSSSSTVNPKGFYRPRVFYSPKYVANQPVLGRTDLRSTIYWNPNIITDKNGNATVNFFNADGRGTYRAVIEGIDGEGNIGRTVIKYEVK